MNQANKPKGIYYSDLVSHHQAGALFSLLSRTQDSDFMDIFNHMTVYAINDPNQQSPLYGLKLCSLFLFDPSENNNPAYLNLKNTVQDMIGLEEVSHPEEYQSIEELALWMRTGFDQSGALAFQALLFDAYPEFLRQTTDRYEHLDEAGKKEVLDFILYAADSPLYAKLVEKYGHDRIRVDVEQLIVGNTQDIYLLLMENLSLYENICNEYYPEEMGMYIGLKNLFSLDYLYHAFVQGLSETQAAIIQGILEKVEIITES